MENTYALLKKLISKCDFEYEGSVISKELLMQSYFDFLAQTIDEDKHNVGIVLHTGSICFDVVSILVAAITIIFFSENDSEDVVYSLNEGDTVLYGSTKKQRYTFVGFYDIDQNKSENCILLSQSDNSKTSVSRKSWNRIEPYNGNSNRMDGRGIRKINYSRSSFIANVFEIEEKSIPSVTDKSSVIVMPRERADLILNNVCIKYAGISISLLEVVTASYFTESEEYQYGGNPGKIEPTLKITGKVSVARDLVMDKTGNQTVGIIVLGTDSITRGGTELTELMNRRSLKYVFLACNIDFDNAKQLIEEYEDSKVFACTKDFMGISVMNIVENNIYTRELSNQINISLNKEVKTKIVFDNACCGEILNIKKALIFLKKSDYMSEQKDYFIIQAYSLVNLFLTSAFPMKKMEELIRDKVLDIISPKSRIDELQEISANFPAILQEKTTYVTRQLKKTYESLYSVSDKYDELKYILEENADKKIAIVVPKAYYANILVSIDIQSYMWDENNLIISTVNKFDNAIIYDEIVVLGDIKGKNFDVFRCKSSLSITVLIYEFEAKFFNYRSKASNNLDRFYNRKAGVTSITEESLPINYENIDEINYQEVQAVDTELELYISQINDMAATQFISKNVPNNSGMLAEIIAVGSFSEGEKVFFTKSYRAYVFDRMNEDVLESEVTKLTAGDTLIFTNNNQVTKDIVDIVLEKLISTSSISGNVKDAYEKSKYWKEILKKYKQEKELTYHQLSIELGKFGSTKHEVTIRSWLDEDLHIVGPKDGESFQQIAELTQDEVMLADSNTFKNACIVVRSMRVKILKKIALSIINKLKGKAPENDPLLEVVYDNVNDLAVMMQLVSITEIETKVPINLVNRPLIF